jgi:hypothetical protein
MRKGLLLYNPAAGRLSVKRFLRSIMRPLRLAPAAGELCGEETRRCRNNEDEWADQHRLTLKCQIEVEGSRDWTIERAFRH